MKKVDFYKQVFIWFCLFGGSFYIKSLVFIKLYITRHLLPWPMWLSWLECLPINQKVTGSIPRSGHGRVYLVPSAHIHMYLQTNKKNTLPFTYMSVKEIQYLSRNHKWCLKKCVTYQVLESLWEQFVDEVKLSLLDLLQQGGITLRVNNVSKWKRRAECLTSVRDWAE